MDKFQILSIPKCYIPLSEPKYICVFNMIPAMKKDYYLYRDLSIWFRRGDWVFVTRAKNSIRNK
jgi:hypothetical protein